MEEVKEWIEKAERDLLAAEVNLREGFYDVSAFLSHQAAEKALKAFYILKFKRLWKTHDLVGWGEKLEIDDKLMRLLEPLNEHYIKTRYPTGPMYTKKMAKEAMQTSKKVLIWVKNKIKN
jgi:HEPN domain-containing protein